MNILMQEAKNIVADVYDSDSSMEHVVAKVLLHDGILYALSLSKLSEKIVFQGGTALQRVYGNTRLSEDLDFSCNFELYESSNPHKNVSYKQFYELGKEFEELVRTILKKMYNIPDECLIVQPPQNDFPVEGIGVQKWKIKIKVGNHVKSQIVNVEIANVTAYDYSPQMVLTFGKQQTPPIFIQTESEREILADKAVALICRDYLKYRDVFDVNFLKRVEPDISLVEKKLLEYGAFSRKNILEKTLARIDFLQTPKAAQEFYSEISRFVGLHGIQKMESVGVAPNMLEISCRLMERCTPLLDQYPDEAEEENSYSPCP